MHGDQFPHHQANAASRAGDRHDHRPGGGTPHRHRRLVGILALLVALGIGVWLMTFELETPPAPAESADP